MVTRLTHSQAGTSTASSPKFDPNGALLWLTFLGSSEIDEGLAIDVDGGGNIFVTGRSFDPWGVPVNPFTASATDGYLARLDTQGLLVWHTFFGGTSNDWGQAVKASDTQGIVYVGGTSESTWGENPIVPYTARDEAFVAAFDANTGVRQWNTFAGSTEGNDIARAVALDNTNHLYIAGQSTHPWGSPVMPFVGGIEDAFVAKLNAGNGERLWHSYVGGGGDDVILDMDVDGQGDVIVTGFSNTDWGNPIDAFAGEIDSFTAKLNPSGHLLWNTFMGGGGDDRGIAVTTDANSNIYPTGFSGNWGNPVDPHSGNSTDAFVAQLDMNGQRQWNAFLGDAGDDRGRGIGVDASGHLIVVGSSNASWGTPIHPYAGGQEFFVAKIIIANQPPVADDDLYATDEDTSLSVPQPGVLDGDTDAESDALTAILDSPTSHGHILLNSDGSFSYVPDMDYCGVDTFTYHANDGSDSSNVAEVILNVACVNDPPVVTASQASIELDEGLVATITGAVSDADSDPVSLSVSEGAVTNNGDGTWSWSWSTSDGPSDSQIVTIFADDGNGGTSQITFELTVNNVAPTAVLISNDGPIDEGGSATITIDATDPAGANDPLSFSFDCDNNGVYEIGPQPNNSANCVFDENGTFTVKILVEDGDGGALSESTEVLVNNVAPTINALTYDGPFGDGSVTIVVDATDPAGASDPLYYGFDCDGDGVYEVTQTTNTASCFLSGGGTHTVNVRVADDDGGEALGSISISTPAAQSAVVLGEEGVCVKQLAKVHTGDVVATQSSPGPYLCSGVELSVGQKVVLSPSSRLFGDSVSLKCGAVVHEVHYNELINGCSVDVPDPQTPLVLPAPALPTLPSISPGTDDINVPPKRQPDSIAWAIRSLEGAAEIDHCPNWGYVPLWRLGYWSTGQDLLPGPNRSSYRR